MTTVRGDVATMSDSVLQDYHTVSHSSGIAPPEELEALVHRKMYDPIYVPLIDNRRQ